MIQYAYSGEEIMSRVILHSDINYCYAQIELLYRPELDRNIPLSVGGDPEARHGIVLASTPAAKKRGVKTGMALWQAREVCPDIMFVPPRMDLYLYISRITREIYHEYSDLVEPFGIDEAWIDITHSAVRGSGTEVAEELRERMKREVGLTVSVGVSWNKIFAKFGSDYRKPDAMTQITADNYRSIVWSAPAGDLLYVGPATRRKLRNIGIFTIGELANADPEMLRLYLGRMGLILRCFARGEDQTPVSPYDAEIPVKSIGNGTTTPRDLTTDADVRVVLCLLAESVAARLKENGFMGRRIGITVRDNGLYSFDRQRGIPIPTNISSEIMTCAMQLFSDNYRWPAPVRSVGVRVGDLVSSAAPYQLDLFTDERMRERQYRMDLAVNDVRRRYGHNSILRARLMTEPALAGLDAKADDHMNHPHSYFERGNRTGAEEVTA